MNHVSAPHVGPLSRSSTDRPFAALGELLQAAKQRWHDYQARREEARSLLSVSEMDPHMLRDIGAPEHLIARATEGRRMSHWSDGPFRMSMVLMAIAAIGMAQPAPAADAAATRGTNGMVGVFTGEYVNGAPVYRFPAVIVAAPKSAASARTIERVAHPRPMRAPAKGAA